MPRYYMICDRCGFSYGDVLLPLEPPEISCPECGHTAAWVFPTLEAALQHSQDIEQRAIRQAERTTELD